MSRAMSASFWRELRVPLAVVLGFSLVINLALLAPSLFMLQVFDRVMTTRSVETLVMLGLIATATLLLMGVLEYFRTQALAAVGVLVEQRYGPRLLEHLLAGPAAVAPPYPDGLRDLAAVRTFLSGTGIVALCDTPWVLVYLAVIFLFHPVLGALATGCTVLLLVLALLNERVSKGPIGTLQDASRAASRFVDSAGRQSETVLALGMTGSVTRRWASLAQRIQGAQVAISVRGGLFGAITRLMRQFIQVLMLAVGAWLVIDEGATPGVMLACTIVLGRALAPVESLVAGWRALTDARAALRRLQQWLRSAADERHETELPVPAGPLEVDNLTVKAPGSDRLLLDRVSFTVKAGQVLAVVGASGSGKTTLARTLVGVLPPVGGQVRMGGADIHQWDPQRRGAWTGYLSQDVTLFTGTVAHNIARLGEIDSPAVLAAAEAARVQSLVLRFPQGFDTPVGDGGVQLSGGQRQRVALARALYRDPALVVLDEPDASLDAEGEQALLEALRGLRARGAVVVVVTQRRALLSVADAVIVMKEGRVEQMAQVGAGAAGGARGGQQAA